MSGIRRVANHFNYIRSNWMVVAAGFILTLTAILVVGSLARAGGDVLAADDYGTAGYVQNGGYPASSNNNDYNKNGGYPANSSYGSNDAKNGGYPVDNNDYYKNGGYPVTTGNNNGCHSGCGHTPTPTPTPYPRYTCNTLSATKLSERQVRFTTSASASGGASIIGYRYEFGDGGVQNGSSSITHTYNRGGTFTARAWVLLRVNGQQKWVTSNACTRTVMLTTQNHCPYNNSNNGGYDRYCTPRPTPTPTYVPCNSCNGGHGGGNGGYPVGGGSGSVSNNDNNNQNSNTNNNNSSANATATANVTVNQAANPAPNVSTASTVGGSSAPTGGPIGSSGMSDQYPVMELPQTGSADAALNIIGLGSLVAAGTAYAASRKEFLQTVFRR